VRIPSEAIYSFRVILRAVIGGEGGLVLLFGGTGGAGGIGMGAGGVGIGDGRFGGTGFGVLVPLTG
jgi:hypothetical protein